MKLKISFFSLVVAFSLCLQVSAVNYKYTGIQNVPITELSGFGPTGFYLLHGNLNIKGTLGSEKQGGYYDAITAIGEEATENCVFYPIAATDSTYYLFFPSTISYLKVVDGSAEVAITHNQTEATAICIKKSSNILGTFTLSAINKNGSRVFLEDGGKTLIGVTEAEISNDGKNDWTIYRADVQIDANFPLLFNAANGLPPQTSQSTTNGNTWISPVMVSDQTISSFRMTVLNCAPKNNYFNGYVFFALSELEVFDENDNKVNLTPGNFTANAIEASEGSLDYLCDGITKENSNYFHSTWNSSANDIGEEHYIEVKLPLPMQRLKIAITPRYSSSWGNGVSKNYPCEIAITKGGEAYNPYSSYNMETGETVTNGAVTTTDLYVMGSENSNSVRLYAAYSNNAARTRRNANADCVFSFVDAGGGMFYIRHYLRNAYVADPTGDQRIGLTSYKANAGKFIVGTDGTLKSSNGYGLYMMSDASMAARKDTNAIWTLETVTIDNTAAKEALKNVIESTQLTYDLYADSFPSYNVDEKEILAQELGLAQKVADDNNSTVAEILKQTDALNRAAAKLRALETLVLSDSINKILMSEKFADEAGAYPPKQYNILSTAMEDAQEYFDRENFETVLEIELYITKIKNILANFWKSKIVVTHFPLTLTTEDGLPGTLNATGKQYVWTSPVFYMEEPIEKFRFTLIESNNVVTGYARMALSEMYVYDANGKPLELTVDNFATNAQEPTEGPLKNICDGITDPTNYFHSM